MEFTGMTLAGLSAKLIAAGVAGWTAGKAEGWGTDEAKAFQAGLDAVPAFAAFLKAKDRQAAPLQLYCELVTAAFGEAWRRHWAYDERLAPRGSSSGLRAWFLPAKKRERLAQLERRLRMGRFEAVLLGDGGAAGELELLGKLGEPLRSPWYRALWEAFATLDELDEGPPLLFLADSGAHAAAKPKLEFEEHFGIAFREGLASEKGQPLREWLGTLDQEKAPRVRELLAARISSFRREHVFGRQAGGSEVAYLPLEDLYVEPRAKVVKERRGQVEEPDARPVLTFVEQLLQLPSTRGLIVQADFGRGKSMTARTLAYRCAESYLRDAVTPSSAVPFPIFARCSDTLRSRDLTLEGTAQRAQSALLRGVDKSALPRVDLAGQAYLFLLDGLDEVQLSESEAQELFDALLDANGSKFVVFGRPGAIPSSVAEREGIVRIELQDFDSSQVEQWLERWMALHGEGDRPKLEELEAKNLLELCATPVLLFMVAQTWSVIRHKADVDRIDIYELFIRLMARSKLEHEAPQPVVLKAAIKLKECLVSRGLLAATATPEDAVVVLLERIAWIAHELAYQNKALTEFHVQRILNEDLDTAHEELKLMQHGLVLTFDVDLEGGAPVLHFWHKSFREYLVARFWSSVLRKIIETEDTEERRALEDRLCRARLLQSDDNSLNILLAVLGPWPVERRGQVVDWARRIFNDEELNARTLLKDTRWRLREAALAIGSALASDGLSARTVDTLNSLILSVWAHHEQPMIRASKLNSPRAWLSSSNLLGVELAHAQLSGAMLSEAVLFNANLQACVLDGSELALADLRFAVLMDASLRGAHLSYAQLRGAVLTRACLDDAQLKGVQAAGYEPTDWSGASLKRANLTNADLARGNFHNAALSGADLEHANLQGANLQGANLQGANLEGANLEGANLADADLRGADLEGANLSGANLERAKLHGANLTGANLKGTLLEDKTQPTR